VVGVDPGARHRFIRQRGCVEEPFGDLIEQCGERVGLGSTGRAQNPFDRRMDRPKQDLAYGFCVLLGGPGPQAVFCSEESSSVIVIDRPL